VATARTAGIAIGRSSRSDTAGTYPIAIGAFTEAQNNFAIAIGAGNAAGNAAVANNASGIAIGRNADSINSNTIAIGLNTSVTNINGIALTSGSSVTANNGIAIGASAPASATVADGVALGTGILADGAAATSGAGAVAGHIQISDLAFVVIGPPSTIYAQVGGSPGTAGISQVEVNRSYVHDMYGASIHETCQGAPPTYATPASS